MLNSGCTLSIWNAHNIIPTPSGVKWNITILTYNLTTQNRFSHHFYLSTMLSFVWIGFYNSDMISHPKIISHFDTALVFFLFSVPGLYESPRL